MVSRADHAHPRPRLVVSSHLPGVADETRRQQQQQQQRHQQLGLLGAFPKITPKQKRQNMTTISFFPFPFFVLQETVSSSKFCPAKSCPEWSGPASLRLCRRSVLSQPNMRRAQ